MLKKLTFLAFYMLLSLVAMAQPDASLWRITSDHHGDEPHNENAGDVEFYSCGLLYYYHYVGADFTMHLSVKNEGDEELNIKKIYLMEESAPEWSLSNAHIGKVLQPGEEALVDLIFTDPGSYREGMKAVFMVQSDSWTNPSCGFTIETGNGEGNYCVCKDGVPTTKVVAVGAPIEQDEIFIQSGPCPPDVSCPSPSEVGCYASVGPWSGSGNTSLFSLEKDQSSTVAFPFRNYLIQEGYCPCRPDAPINNVCIESPFPNKASVDLPCPGEPFTVDTSSNCLITLPLVENGALHLPGDYTFEWMVGGFGAVSPFSPGDSAQVTDWEAGDYIFLKITDSEGCLTVQNQIIGQQLLGIPIFILAQGCSQTSFTICAFAGGGGGLREIETRGIDDFEWDVTGGEAEIINQYVDELSSCVEIKGWTAGVEVVVKDPTQLVNNCPVSSRFAFDPFSESLICQFFFNENILVRGEPFTFDDPCSCDDSQNYMAADGRTVFHDILTVEEFEGMGVELSNLMNWYGDSENLMAGPIMVTDGGPLDIDGMENGELIIDFWHFEDEQASATITDELGNGDEDEFGSSVCSSCTPIPTLGQWGIIVLGILMMISFVLVLSNRKQRTFS